MKKLILSLAVLCLLAIFSSGKLMSAESNVHPTSRKLSKFTLASVAYRNLKPDAGYVVIKDLTTGQTYEASLPPTTNTRPTDSGIMLPIGDQIQVTLYSGNGNCDLRFQNHIQTGVSSLYVASDTFQPGNPSPAAIQIQ